MFKAIYYLVRFWLNKLVRNVYWLYRLGKIKKGKNFRTAFPLEIEGKGEQIFGNDCSLGKNIRLGCAIGSKICLDNNATIEDDVVILATPNCNIVIGKNFKLGRSSRLYIQNNWEFGDDVKIETNCAIFSREKNYYGQLIIKNGSHIGDYTIIDVTDNIIIGNDVALGPNCVIYTHDHDYTQKEKAAWKGGLYTKPVSIEDGAWIGSGVTILPGVTIGKRCVVAAGSVVTNNLEENALYGGIPAKFIKSI